MARKKRRPTWSEVAYVNAGPRETLKAFEFAINWAGATHLLGREPESVEEFADVAELSRATAFRQQAAFRKAFPMLEGPSDFNRRAGLDESMNEVKTLATDPVQWRPFVFARMFVVGALPADLPSHRSS